MKMLKTAVALIFVLISFISTARAQRQYNAIYSGIPWFDNRGHVVSAHGACIIKDKGRYYLFGERHTDTSNAFAGFMCYSSTDLYHWKFEDMALPVQDSGRLGPSRVGERVKVMKCPETGEYVMYMHTDNLGYTGPCICYATSGTITGPYKFRGPLLFNDKPIKKWDMGTFQDRDGSGYLLIHGGNIYKLSDDYKSISSQVVKNMTPGFESPAMFRKDSIYYFLGSHLTSWERNDNYYYTATSLKGPWTYRGAFAPEGTLTWNSQTTFVLPIEGSKDTTFLFMGDRWSFPKQASAATYVWQPLVISGLSIVIPKYRQAWQINTSTGVVSPVTIHGKTIESTNKQLITYCGKWYHKLYDSVPVRSSDAKGAYFSVKFEGTQAGLSGLSRPDGGYACILLKKDNGKVLLSSVIDMYCHYPFSGLKFMSPILPEGDYTLTVTVTGKHSSWSDKEGRTYGSRGNWVTLDKVIVKK